MKDVSVFMEEARRTLEENLGDLPSMLAKLLRAGINTGPSAPLVSAWCADNPIATVRIVGVMALVVARAESKATL